MKWTLLLPAPKNSLIPHSSREDMAAVMNIYGALSVARTSASLAVLTPFYYSPTGHMTPSRPSRRGRGAGGGSHYVTQQVSAWTITDGCPHRAGIHPNASCLQG